MKKYEIRFQWKIEDSRDESRGWRTGKTTFICYAKNKVEAINNTIDFAMSLPQSAIEDNNISLNDYRKGNTCCYYYRTQLTRIIRCEVSE